MTNCTSKKHTPTSIKDQENCIKLNSIFYQFFYVTMDVGKKVERLTEPLACEEA
jgi:hypothetical protein